MDVETLREYVKSGLITERAVGELSIFNYTHKCQANQMWDEITNEARGLILNTTTNEVVARPWAKFHNHGFQPYQTEDSFYAYEKLDGSLVISYKDNEGQYKWSTRGSMTSPQSRDANRIAKISTVPLDWTVMGEVLSHSSRVVVSYPKEEVVILGARSIATGKEIDYKKVKKWANSNNLRMVYRAKEDISNLENYLKIAKEANFFNFEGWVLYFPKSGLRIKVKLDSYNEVSYFLGRLNLKLIGSIWYSKQENEEIPIKIPIHTPTWVKASLLYPMERFEIKLKQLEDSIQDLVDARKHHSLREAYQTLTGVHPSIRRAVMYILRYGLQPDIPLVLYQVMFNRSPKI